MNLKSVKVRSIGEVQLVGKNSFKICNFTVDYVENPQYPQVIEFQISGDKADKFVQYTKVGDLVDIDFNLKGREVGDRTYNTLDAWKVWKVANEGKPVGVSTDTEEESDDLPF